MAAKKKTKKTQISKQPMGKNKKKTGKSTIMAKATAKEAIGKKATAANKSTRSVKAKRSARTRTTSKKPTVKKTTLKSRELQSRTKARKTAVKKTASLRRRSGGSNPTLEAVESRLNLSRARTGGQSGDLQGLSNSEGSAAESVDELLEEGNSFEAGIVSGVENAGNADEEEVRTREVPEDDVPEEYLDNER